jgi:hypothetical protein
MTQPVILQGIDATNYLLRYLIDPIAAVRRAYAEFGPFAVLRSPFRFVRFQKTVVALAVGAEFNRQVLSDTALWRTAHVGPGGPRNSASRRMSRGIFRMQGREHEHHRRLLLPPLRRKNIDARDSDLAKLVQDEVKTWPLGKPIDLWQLSRRMLQVLSIGLLFGNDRARGLPIAQMNYRWLRSTWSKGVSLCPLNIPGTPFHRMLSTAEALEREVLAWVACGAHDSGTNNFLSILATSPDETGCKPPPLETRNAACRKHRQRAAARQPAERLTPSSRADRKWSPHIAALVRRSGAPVLPIYLRGPTRINFQILGFISPLLQNARSVAAVSAFRNKDLHVTIGRLIRPVELQAFATDEEGAAFLQRQTEMLAHS